MGRRDDSPKASDLPTLVKVARQAWKTQADARTAYLKAVDETLKSARQVVEDALAKSGYTKAEYLPGGERLAQAGFYTRHVPVQHQIYLEILGRPSFMVGQNPDQVLRSWIRIISLHLRAPTFLISQKHQGAPGSGGSYLSIIFQ